MHQDSKDCLRQAILHCLPIYQSQFGKFEVPCRVFTKQSEGVWKGEIVNRPDVIQFYGALASDLANANEPFLASLRTHHPAYTGIIGFPGLGDINLGMAPPRILAESIGAIQIKFGTFEVDETAVESVVSEVADFIGREKIKFLFRTQLRNFKATSDLMEFSNELSIRRMTENELSQIYGGRLDMQVNSHNCGYGVDEFCFEGTKEFRKTFGSSPVAPIEKTEIKEELDQAVLYLRAFKPGPVAYDLVSFTPLSFCPIPVIELGLGDTHIPFGSYTLTADEETDLLSNAKEFFRSFDAVAMACSRLADAEMRINSRDRLIDAVIGLESILLGSSSTSELSFRFKLNFSLLFDNPEERHTAFDIAENIYSLRSKLAHGANVSKTQKVGSRELTLEQVAILASRILRQVLRHRLRNAEVMGKKIFGTTCILEFDRSLR